MNSIYDFIVTKTDSGEYMVDVLDVNAFFPTEKQAKDYANECITLHQMWNGN